MAAQGSKTSEDTWFPRTNEQYWGPKRFKTQTRPWSQSSDCSAYDSQV